MNLGKLLRVHKGSAPLYYLSLTFFDSNTTYSAYFMLFSVLTLGGGGQRTLSVLAQGSSGYSGKMLKANTANGKHVLYIIPLQETLDMTPLPPDAAEFQKMPKSSCKTCGQCMPIQLLVEHIKSCVEVIIPLHLKDTRMFVTYMELFVAVAHGHCLG